MNDLDITNLPVAVQELSADVWGKIVNESDTDKTGSPFHQEVVEKQRKRFSPEFQEYLKKKGNRGFNNVAQPKLLAYIPREYIEEALQVAKTWNDCIRVKKCIGDMSSYEFENNKRIMQTSYEKLFKLAQFHYQWRYLDSFNKSEYTAYCTPSEEMKIAVKTKLTQIKERTLELINSFNESLSESRTRKEILEEVGQLYDLSLHREWTDLLFLGDGKDSWAQWGWVEKLFYILKTKSDFGVLAANKYFQLMSLKELKSLNVSFMYQEREIEKKEGFFSQLNFHHITQVVLAAYWKKIYTILTNLETSVENFDGSSWLITPELIEKIKERYEFLENGGWRPKNVLPFKAEFYVMDKIAASSLYDGDYEI